MSCVFDSFYTQGTVGSQVNLLGKCPDVISDYDSQKKYRPPQFFKDGRNDGMCSEGLVPDVRPLWSAYRTKTMPGCPAGISGNLCDHKKAHQCHIEDLCKGVDPQMPDPTPTNSTTKCCTGKISTDKATQECEGRDHCCGVGYCPTGGSCGFAMAEYCGKYGLDNNCETFLDQTTIANRRVVADQIIDSWYKNGQKIQGNPGNKAIIEICNKAPGACDLKLDQICQQLTSLDEMNRDPELIKLCGCHIPSRIYDPAYKGVVPEKCAPSCVYPDAIQRGNGRGQPDACTQNVCVIDNVTIDIVNSNVGGGVTLKSLCPGGGNRCYISNDTVNVLNSKISGDVKFLENCGSCTMYDANDPTAKHINLPKCRIPSGKCKTTKDCKSGETCQNGLCFGKNGTIVSGSGTQPSKWWLLLPAGILLIIVIVIAVILIRRRKN